MNNTIISILSIILTSYLGSKFTKSNVNNDWYDCIKPSITPPKYIFPIVRLEFVFNKKIKIYKFLFFS